MSEHGIMQLRLESATGLEFEAHFDARNLTLDSGEEIAVTNPVQTMLASLAACTGMDVIEILRTKRQTVTGYTIEMSGERASEHPRRFTSITLVHRITGHEVSEAAVAEAVRLADEKYCSVRHSLRTDLPVEHRIEIAEG